MRDWQLSAGILQGHTPPVTNTKSFLVDGKGVVATGLQGDFLEVHGKGRHAVRMVLMRSEKMVDLETYE